jgi:hypothetical protein
LLFHEPWWLSAATGEQCQDVVVRSGDDVVGRLPFVTHRRMGFTVLRMPAFTHVLGPAVNPGAGKPQTQLTRRMSITRGLIDQLPAFDYFKQALPSALADGLAFQDRGFQVSPQYTFEIDCRDSTENIWDGMHFKTRQHVRRAEEKYVVTGLDNASDFVQFYRDNLQRRGLRAFAALDQFPTLAAACWDRDSGEILSACRPDGRPVAMVFLVWGGGVMYYLMSTRSAEADDNGSISLLIWTAIQRAHSRGLRFDLDGVSTSGTARFLSGFGGRIKIRLIVQKSRLIFGALQSARLRLLRPPNAVTADFT